jgi:hypothetical protein
MDENIRIPFNPPRQCKEAGKTWKLSAEGEDDLFLPITLTQREFDGNEVVAAVIPQWLAVKEGLVEDDEPSLQGEEDDKMTRDDWYMLGLAMALVSRGECETHEVAWEARKLAQKLLGREDT